MARLNGDLEQIIAKKSNTEETVEVPPDGGFIGNRDKYMRI